MVTGIRSHSHAIVAQADALKTNTAEQSASAAGPSVNEAGEHSISEPEPIEVG